MAVGWLLSIVAWAQTQYDTALIVLNRVRRRLLLPLALWGGRDMALLTNGQWVDGVVPPEQVRWHYDAEKHVLTYRGAEGARLVRWPWLSVACGEKDLSEFFQGLRLSAGHGLADDKAVMLFAHQKRWVPAGDLHIVRRDGSEETYALDENGVHVRHSAPQQGQSAEERIAQINYVK